MMSSQGQYYQTSERESFPQVFNSCLSKPQDTTTTNTCNSEYPSCGENDGSSSKPLATWYDAAHEHFVALLKKPSAATEEEEDMKLFVQTLTIPSMNYTHHHNNTLDYYSGEELIESKPITVSLQQRQQQPKALPLLVKFSLDMNLVAIQLSATEVRVIQIHHHQQSQKKGFFHSEQTQWTIDLLYSSKATSSGKYSPKRRSWKSFGSNNSDAATTTATTTTATTSAATTTHQTNVESILPGAIVWSDHGGNSQDLIIVTSYAVRFYKVSIMRNQLAKTRKYNHLSDSFWYEPTLRVLLVGQSIIKNSNNEVIHNGATNNNKQLPVIDPLASEEHQPVLFWNSNNNNTKEFAATTTSSSSSSSTTTTKGIIFQTFFLHFSAPSVINDTTDAIAATSTFMSLSRYNTDTSTVSLLNSSPPYKFQLELPPPIQLPPFALWNTNINNNDKLDKGNNKQQHNILTIDEYSMSSSSNIALVNLYGHAYCVQVRVQCVSIFHLNKVEKTVTPLRQYSTINSDDRLFTADGGKQETPIRILVPIISTVDNILCIHYVHEENTYFYDIAAAAKDGEDNMPFCIENSAAFQECHLQQREEEEEEEKQQHSATNIYSEGFSFISPHYLLHCDGHLFRLKLNLRVLSNCRSTLSPSSSMASNNNVSSILKFFLRRQSSPTAAAHSIVLQYLFHWIQTSEEEKEEDSTGSTTKSCINIWMETIAMAYADAPETISVWDYESSIPLIHKTAFLEETNSQLMVKKDAFNNITIACHRPPQCFSSAITQTEVLENVLFPCAHQLIGIAAAGSNSNIVSLSPATSSITNLRNIDEDGDKSKRCHLKHLSDVALLFVEALSAHSVLPCPALLSFILSLKLKLNDVETLDILLHSYITSDSINITARRIKKLFSNTTQNGYQIARQGTGELAETMFSLATASGGNNDGRSSSNAANDSTSYDLDCQDVVERERVQQQHQQQSSHVAAVVKPHKPWRCHRQQCQHILIKYALDLMCSVALYTTAAMHLLRLGRTMDAISICLMELEMPYPFQVARQSASSLPGIRAVDFFIAFINAEEQRQQNERTIINDDVVAERIRLFYHLYSFLMRWDKDSLVIIPLLQDNNSLTSTSSSYSRHQQQLLSSEGSDHCKRSALAEDHPAFPDHLFGGADENPIICSKIRQLFGYPAIL